MICTKVVWKLFTTFPRQRSSIKCLESLAFLRKKDRARGKNLLKNVSGILKHRKRLSVSETSRLCKNGTLLFFVKQTSCIQPLHYSSSCHLSLLEVKITIQTLRSRSQRRRALKSISAAQLTVLYTCWVRWKLWSIQKVLVCFCTLRPFLNLAKVFVLPKERRAIYFGAA